MILRLHPTTLSALSQRAEALEFDLLALCERIIAQYYSHATFLELMHSVKMLPQYRNNFACNDAMVRTLSVRNNKRNRDAHICADILCAYAIGIAHREKVVLKEIPAELQLAIFTE